MKNCVSLVGEVEQEQTWSNFRNEAARFQDKAGADYVHSLHDVWSVMDNMQNGDQGLAQEEQVRRPYKEDPELGNEKNPAHR